VIGASGLGHAWYVFPWVEMSCESCGLAPCKVVGTAGRLGFTVGRRYILGLRFMLVRLVRGAITRYAVRMV
jgi:hypothetical protein